MADPSRASLTAQGRGLLAGGLTAGFCGLALAERDLLRIGLVVALLPLVALVWVRLASRGLVVRRHLHADTIEAGSTTRVDLEVEHDGWPLPDVLLQDTCSAALGARSLLWLRHLGRGVTGPLGYDLTGTVRGVFDVGPLDMRIRDPFGMAVSRRSSGDTDQLTVTPHLADLPPIRLAATWTGTGTGENRPRSFAVGNAADVTVRDYRTGDDLRRVHWRSTARTGELMVRREEQPWQSRCTLLLDNRTSAHRGSREDSSLEVAISTAGSVALHLARVGYQVRLVTASGDEVGRGWHDGNTSVNVAVLLEELALLRRTGQPGLDPGWIDDSTSQSLLIAVFGVLRDFDRPFLERLRRHGVINHALAIDPTPWSHRGGDVAATALLAGEGWRVSELSSLAMLPAAWRGLGR